MQEIRVAFELRDSSGALVNSGNAERTIPPQGRVSRFIDELFPQAETSNFRGSVVTRAQTGEVVVIGLELQEGEKLTTLPVERIR